MDLNKSYSNSILKSQRTGLFLLMLAIISMEIAIQLTHQPKQPEIIQLSPELMALQEEINLQKSGNHYQLNKNINYKPFNPNQLSSEGWQNIGFSPKQADVILNYKNKILGGSFSCKDEIAKCFVINESKFQEMESYIQLPDNCSRNPVHQYAYKENQPSIQYQDFDPNSYRVSDWQKIGFSDKQANSILKYKKLLGGSFANLEQIRDSYVISDEKFEEMKPYIRLQSKEENNERVIKQESSKPEYEIVNVNDLDEEGWAGFGFTEKQIRTIFNYKRSLGGNFKDAETLKKCYSISEDKFEEIKAYIVFD